MTTAKFGEKKFGTFKFGPTVLDWPRFGLEVDWDMNGAFDGYNDGTWMSDMTVERGRRYYINSDGNGFEAEETGRFSADLVDEAGRYDPYNISSPIYPNVGPGRFFRSRMRTPTDQVFPLMAGTIMEPTINNTSGLRQIHIEGRDGWQFLRDQKSQINIPLQQNIYADEAIQRILDTVGWPSLWGVDLDGGVDRQPWWWVEDQSASAAISDLVFSELGRVWVAADGKVSFRSRHFIDSPVATITKTDIRDGSFMPRNTWEVVRNSIRVVAKPRVQQAAGELWRLPDTLRVGFGQTIENVFAEFMFNGERCPATGVLQPVAGLDYIVNSNADGSGIDLTAFFTVSATMFSTAAKLKVINNGTLTGHFILLRLRGAAIAATNSVPVIAEDLASQALYKAIRTFDMATNWVQNTNAARSFATFLKALLAVERPYFQFDLLPNPDLQFSLDLGQQVRLNLPDDGIDDYFRVHYIRHQSRDRGLMAFRTTVMVEPSIKFSEDIWVVPHRVPMRVAY